jgi:hypothetical protein
MRRSRDLHDHMPVHGRAVLGGGTMSAVCMLDVFENQRFECSEIVGYWNGFAMPLFTREQGLAIVAATERPEYDGEPLTYDAASDTFTIVADDGEIDTYPRDPETGLYGIGAASWTWEVAR